MNDKDIFAKAADSSADSHPPLIVSAAQVSTDFDGQYAPDGDVNSVLRRDKDHPATLHRARQRIEALAKAGDLEVMLQDAAIADGWFGALHVEGLLGKEQYEKLDGELRQAISKWEQLRD